MAAFAKLFDIIPGWVYAILLGLALLTAAVERSSHQATKVTLAEFKTEVATQKAALADAARIATEARAELSTYREKIARKVDDEVNVEKRKTADAVAAGGATRKLLLDATARLSARSGSGDADPGALQRAEEAAAAFGVLLGQCDKVAEDLGRDAEDLATQVRGLQQQYLSLLFKRPAGPLTNRDQVDPGFAPVWDVVVDAPLPYAASKPRGYDSLLLARE
jgi:hypothetical protein